MFALEFDGDAILLESDSHVKSTELSKLYC